MFVAVQPVPRCARKSEDPSIAARSLNSGFVTQSLSFPAVHGIIILVHKCLRQGS